MRNNNNLKKRHAHASKVTLILAALFVIPIYYLAQLYKNKAPQPIELGSITPSVIKSMPEDFISQNFYNELSVVALLPKSCHSENCSRIERDFRAFSDLVHNRFVSKNYRKENSKLNFLLLKGQSFSLEQFEKEEFWQVFNFKTSEYESLLQSLPEALTRSVNDEEAPYFFILEYKGKVTAFSSLKNFTQEKDRHELIKHSLSRFIVEHNILEYLAKKTPIKTMLRKARSLEEDGVGSF